MSWNNTWLNWHRPFKMMKKKGFSSPDLSANEGSRFKFQWRFLFAKEMVQSRVVTCNLPRFTTIVGERTSIYLISRWKAWFPCCSSRRGFATLQLDWEIHAKPCAIMPPILHNQLPRNIAIIIDVYLELGFPIVRPSKGATLPPALTLSQTRQQRKQNS